MSTEPGSCKPSRWTTARRGTPSKHSTSQAEYVPTCFLETTTLLKEQADHIQEQVNHLEQNTRELGGAWFEGGVNQPVPQQCLIMEELEAILASSIVGTPRS
jgi:hypothetical protein